MRNSFKFSQRQRKYILVQVIIILAISMTTALGQKPAADTAKVKLDNPDSVFSAPDSLQDTLGLYSGTAPAESTYAEEENQGKNIQPSIYLDRVYISTGPVDEIKAIPDIFVQNIGPIGSPALPLDYLNVAGADITLNGLPFPYQGIYRPYVMGTDLNTIPWEVLEDIQYNPRDDFVEGLDFIGGRPRDDVNRSDVDVSRGPYGYKSARWRFFRPFGKKTYGYFTVGFKTSGQPLPNSDYDGYHVNGGISRKIGKGQIAFDTWKHIAKSGQNSFEFIPSQITRQSRGLYRYELRYSSPVSPHADINATGFYHRSAQTIYGYTSPIKSKYDIGGGRIRFADSLENSLFSTSLDYYRIFLYGINRKNPRVNDIEYAAKFQSKSGKIHYNIELAYAWNENDHGEFLPKAKLSYGLSPVISPFISAARFRRLPDLYLLNFNDEVTGLGAGTVLGSYVFSSNSSLESPVTTRTILGAESKFGKIESMLGISFKKIDSQIYLNYISDGAGNYQVSPVNFNDNYIEYYMSSKYSSGPISGELAGSLRNWEKQYFADGLEKGPAALGFARISYLREFFVPRLFLGGSLEGKFSSRRDYRSLTPGLTSGFAVLSGRLEFKYKDFIFWLNDENITNAAYITWWNAYQQPRTVWWGFRWVFFD